MKLQNLTVIFIIIIIPVILLVSLYISTGLKTLKYQSLYDTGLLTATHDAIYAFELNTAKNEYSDNSETKRNILKSSVKMFEKSLANTCNISSYNTDEIEEYIPAIVFGMHDGFYMYAPSYNSQTRKYEHNLKNYVYYSETLDDGTVIIYSLDNYVTVSGDFGIKEGYLIDLSGSEPDGTKYKGITINQDDTDAIKYYKEAYYFTNWFLNTAKIQNKKKNLRSCDYLNINSLNNPEDENSAFVQHKREIMKNKIESVLNSSITAYSERTWNRTYKMPKLSEEDWQKIYSNISMITFFQGKSIGLTKYNGYCVLNSTNSNEYVNPNLMYFTDENETYHDIRCEKKGEQLTGYKIGDFEKMTIENTDDEGNVTKSYEYKHKELACYDCINGSLKASASVHEYVQNASDEIKTAYWTSLARERYNTAKLFDTACVITYELDGLTSSNNALVVPYGESYTTIITPVNSLTHRRPKEIIIMMDGKILTGGYTYNDVNGEIVIFSVTGNVNIIAATEQDKSNISFENSDEVNVEDTITAEIDQSYRVRVYKFIPKESGAYRFWSDDANATRYITDPYAYLYDGQQYTIEQLDSLVEQYISSKDAWNTFNYNNDIKPLIYNDDGGEGYNFSMEQYCEANHTYYLVVRTYTANKVQTFSPIYIEKVNNISRFVQRGKEIDGLTSQGNRVITLHIGDYINYKCYEGEEYSYTSVYAKNGTKDQLFRLEWSKDSRWRIIGVENDSLLIAADNNMPSIYFWHSEGYNNGLTELNNICRMYGYGKGASSARLINKADINSLLETYGDTRRYGNDQSILPDPVEFTPSDTDDDLFSLLFPNNLYNYWIGNSYEDEWNAGFYGTWAYDDLHWANLYASHIKYFDYARVLNIRPVVTLKKAIKLEKQADNSYNIID